PIKGRPHGATGPQQAAHRDHSDLQGTHPVNSAPSASPPRHKVLVVDPIAPQALEGLRAAYDVCLHMQPSTSELVDLLQGMDAIVLRSGVKLPADVIDAATQLRVIARAGNGTDNIDLAAAERAKIQVFNIPSVSSGAVAELALGLTYAVTRHIALADRQIRSNLWKKSELAGIELADKTMGIVGLGGIGSRLAALARGVGMRVVGSVSHSTPERESEFARTGVRLMATEEVLRQADVVALTCPLNDHTRHLITSAELVTMKPGAYLVNVSRGGVVDEDDLYEALERRHIAGAAIDVLAAEREPSRLAELDNVVLTPHIGAMSVDSQNRIGAMLLDGLALGLAGQDAPTRIV
ncbi:hydroxyacid dehydrogenase, partial [Streptomyces chartreusis]|uniref:hydroxyacid dehydrogenase n=1 Tax=Streptomyces chartreusis TaxID=1969 RepID=UPI003659856E